VGSRSRLLLLCGLFALALFHMREAVFEGRVYFERDIHLQWHGQMESFVHAVAEGSWPTWDPWVGFGQPLLANPNNQVLYPPTWLNLLMVPETYYKLYLLAHLVLGGLGMARLARRLGGDGTGALVAGGAYLLSGPFLSLGNAWNHLAGAAILPWIVLGADRLADAPSLRRAAALGAVLAAALLAGSPDFMLLALPAAAGLAAWRARRRGVPAPRLVAPGAVALGLGALLSAAQMLPAMELVSRSARAALASAERDHWSLHPLAAVQALIPTTLQAAAIPSEWRELLFEGREPYLFSIYLGLPTLVLAGLGCRRAPGFPRLLLLAVAAFGLLWALGRFTPFHGLLAALVPPLGMLRFPVKGALLVAFAAALLAGRGAQRLQEERPGRLFRLALLALAAGGVGAGVLLNREPDWSSFAFPSFLAAGLLLMVGLLLALRNPRARTAALAGLALADLSFVHRHLNPTAPADFYRDRPAVIGDVAPDETGRFLVLDYSAHPDWAPRYLGRTRAFVVAARPGARHWWAGAMGLRLYPVAPILSGWRVPGSYSRDLLGLLPPPLVAMNDALVGTFPGPAFVRLLEAGGVSRLATLHDVDAAGLRPLRRVRGPFFEDIRVYAVPGARPRAFLAADAAPPASLEALLGARPDATPRGSARIASFRSDRVRLEVEAEAPSRVVLLDAWDPGWRATLDGVPVPVEIAELAFRGVRVPAGRHAVEMRYAPRSLPVGLALSALGLALAVTAGRSRRP